MDEIAAVFQQISNAIPSGSKKLLFALILIVCLDYITGICVAVKEKKLSSKIGFKGLATKVMIFAMVALTAVIDYLLIGEGSALCNLTILFYCANELISICENANNMGLPLPEKLVSFLKEFQGKQK